ncbi:LuxR family transcriptional regulator [Streptomyces sp. NPDC047928]|uniref:LuxR family transcriptional regulator n=1 Tax=unclassified Streptomyces TaxID=2593676 RepID=UPI00371D37C1
MEELTDLGETALRAYSHVLEHGSVTPGAVRAALGVSQQQLDHAVDELLGHRLATREAEGPGARLRAVSPYTAAAELVGPEENLLRRRLEVLERTRARLDALGPLYERAYRLHRDSGAVEVVASRERVMLLIADAAARCAHEVLTVQPGGGRPAGYLERALPRDLDMLARGVSLRTLYQHTARYSPATQEYVRAVTDAGAEVRTLGELFGKMLVFDRTTAFLPVRDDANGAVVLREPSAVAFLGSVFTHAWHAAEPFGTTYTETTELQLHDSIAELLTTGAKDEVIARKLGMSLRTLRRRVSDLLDELGATSRFQAGFLLARRLRSDGPPPGPGPLPRTGP